MTLADLIVDSATWFLRVKRELIQKMMAKMQALQDKLDKK
jgi:hypothetical protein